MNRVYNFSAGPSCLPRPVLERIQKNFLNYNNSGMSVMEMSHRSKPYDEIHNSLKEIIKELLGISDDYEILFMQGGASLQFDMIPLNLLDSGAGYYSITGNFANLAYKAAKDRYANIYIANDESDNSFTTIKDFSKWTVSDNASYLHITSNNTIYGLKYNDFPKFKNVPLVCDMSSNIASENIDMSQFDLVYAGAQKNLGPAGLTLVIIKKTLLGKQMPSTPVTLSYKLQAEKNSLYNTPPTFSIYTAYENFKYLKEIGGIENIEKLNKEKASLLYDFIDNSNFYSNMVDKRYRSIMNVPFKCKNADLDAQFVKEAAEIGIISIKGHKLVGGMRASIYNAMEIEGVKYLIDFMKKFEMRGKNV